MHVVPHATCSVGAACKRCPELCPTAESDAWSQPAPECVMAT